jgi:hypothetical protein
MKHWERGSKRGTEKYVIIPTYVHLPTVLSCPQKQPVTCTTPCWPRFRARPLCCPGLVDWRIVVPCLIVCLSVCLSVRPSMPETSTSSSSSSISSSSSRSKLWPRLLMVSCGQACVFSFTLGSGKLKASKNNSHHHILVPRNHDDESPQPRHCFQRYGISAR